MGGYLSVLVGSVSVCHFKINKQTYSRPRLRESTYDNAIKYNSILCLKVLLLYISPYCVMPSKYMSNKINLVIALLCFQTKQCMTVLFLWACDHIGLVAAFCFEWNYHERITIKNQHERITMRNQHEQITMRNQHERITMKSQPERITMRNQHERITIS